MAWTDPISPTRRRMTVALCAAAGTQAFLVPAARAAPRLAIATGPTTGTYHQIGEDLAKFIAPKADVSLTVLSTQGSIENLLRLRYAATESDDDRARLRMVSSSAADDPDALNVKLALVQADVLQAYYTWAAAGHDFARELVEPLRLILPMYAEELHFIVRECDEMKFVHQIKDKRISAGEIGSGSALTARTLYSKMFGERLPTDKLVFQPHRDGLEDLLNGKVDVVLIVAGQPYPTLTQLPEEKREQIRFLALNEEENAAKAALKTYVKTQLRLEAYGNATPASIPALAVRSYLVTYALNRPWAVAPLVRLVSSLCTGLPALRSRTSTAASHNSKWSEVRLEPAINPGDNWQYLEATTRVLRRCAPIRSTPSCSPELKSFGLCQTR